MGPGIGLKFVFCKFCHQPSQSSWTCDDSLGSPWEHSGLQRMLGGRRRLKRKRNRYELQHTREKGLYIDSVVFAEAELHVSELFYKSV